MADNIQGNASPSLNILRPVYQRLFVRESGCPRSLQARDKAPAININVNVNANPLSDTDFDVVLSLNAEAKDGDKVVFVTELIYGGVFRISGFPQEHMLPVAVHRMPALAVSLCAPNHRGRYPQWRFPSVMIDPIDFTQMFAQRVAERQFAPRHSRHPTEPTNIRDVKEGPKWAFFNWRISTRSLLIRGQPRAWRVPPLL